MGWRHGDVTRLVAGSLLASRRRCGQRAACAVLALPQLEKEAKEVESKVRDMMKKAKSSHEHYSNATEEVSGPPSYA